MYCRKCGKQVNGNEELCEECRHNELVFGEEQKRAQQTNANAYNNANANAYYNGASARQPAVNENRMLSFPIALTGTILGVFAYIFMLMSLIYMGKYAVAISGESYYYSAYRALAYRNVAWVFFILGLAGAICALVFGIKSIMAFARVKRDGGVRPIPALVLGIISVVAAGISFLFAFITFIVLMAAI